MIAMALSENSELIIVKLRSRSRSGEGQVRVKRVRRIRFGPELYTIFYARLTLRDPV